MKSFRLSALFAALVLLSPLAAAAQQSTDSAQQSGTRQTSGTVSSVRSGSIVVRTEQNEYRVFVLNRDTVRPQAVQAGARVTVVSASSDTGNTPVAIAVNVTQARPTTGTSPDEPIPAEVRRLESDIARQVRRYRVGVEGGVTIDPEMISVGAHATFGPFFNPNLNVRPSFELGTGEVTTLVAFNVDVLYTIPGASRQTRWAPYVGAGPNFSFSHRGFEGETDGNRFDFGEFNYDTGFNFIVGAQNPKGVFFEMRATAGGVANVRLIAGFNF
jgi:hypothetical protein